MTTGVTVIMAYSNLAIRSGFRETETWEAVTSKFIQILCCLLLFSWPAASAPAPQRETTRSPHGALAIPCENCHTATGWRPIRAVPEFDHNKTSYPLRGMHEKVQCTQCHVKPVFTDVGKNCQDCHADIHQRKMGTDCAQCHSVQGWNITVQKVRDHQNRFPLLGAHAAVQCEDCHKSAAVGQFQGLSTACVSCHLREYQKTTNPNHVSGQFATTCESCHSFDSWLGANFNHAAPPINFPLTNGHANVPCATCHVNGNYSLQIALTDCGNSQCHLRTWQQTNNPVHSTAGPAFAVANCASCHTTKGWDSASFDHSVTGFTLTGTHASPTPTPCTSCHVNNNYTLNSTDCMGCHLAAWQSTPTFGGNVPDHIKVGFPSTASACATCHPITKWADGKFDHNAFGFPLTNSHALVANGGKVASCASCHIGNNYSLNIAPTDCGNAGCHLTTWQTTNNPAHPKAGAPFAAANCSTCHNTITWNTAIFNHGATGWVLTGSHQMAPAGKIVACTDCHVGNNYTFTAANTDCYGCHMAAWQSTATLGGNVPNHIAAQFSISCVTCHTTWVTTGWLGATLSSAQHNWFRIPHNGSVCSDCHLVSTNYATFSCINCHTRTAHQPGMSHPSVGGQYVYGATTCYNCHKN